MYILICILTIISLSLSIILLFKEAVRKDKEDQLYVNLHSRIMKLEEKVNKIEKNSIIIDDGK
jgi:hypothetical protein